MSEVLRESKTKVVHRGERVVTTTKEETAVYNTLLNLAKGGKKKSRKSKKSCIGKRDGKKGCRTCCKKKRKYKKCVTRCMRGY